MEIVVFSVRIPILCSQLQFCEDQNYKPISFSYLYFTYMNDLLYLDPGE